MKANPLTSIPNYVFFKTKDGGQVNIEVFFSNDTIWLTQKLIAELFETSKQLISFHLINLFKEGELIKDSVVKEILTTAPDKKRYNTKYYNLKAIIAVGYRVNSDRATKFRIWATDILEEYIVKGFALDDDRLKSGQHFGQDYFQNLLERIREIRASERRFYQKITDIYALSADYDNSAPITKEFFATVQNKLHWAITGQTAAEIIYSQVDAKKLHMGLKTWRQAPKGKILKSDVIIAKNYLNENHLKQLERIVSAYLDLAEDRASQGTIMNMQDWVIFLNKFIELSNRPILLNLGKISMVEAKIKAEGEYEKYHVVQDKLFESDFDKFIKSLK